MNIRRRQQGIISLELYDSSIKVSNVKKNKRYHTKNRAAAYKTYVYVCCFILLTFLGLFLLQYLISKDPSEEQIIEVIHNNNDNHTHLSSVLYGVTPSESSEDKICQPLVPWQNKMNANCNTLHEHSLIYHGSLINEGYIRSVWKVSNGQEDFVMKTLLHQNVKFSISKMKDQAQDATISDQLVASKFVANVYGYCKSI